MLNRIVSVVLLLIICSAGFSQELSLRFVNQYHDPLTTVTISQGDSIQTYQADENGVVRFNTISSETIGVVNEGYKPYTINTSSISNGETIELSKKFSWGDLLNPMFYVMNGGLWLIIFIVFAETGLFVGFFLPGDSLLFVAGIYSTALMDEFFKSVGLMGSQGEWPDLLVLVSLICLAGIFGNSLGYWFGKKIGPAMYNWKDRFIYKKKYLYDAQEFYQKHGGGAIVFARFLPMIRTFAPIIAGIVKMDRKKFMFYNITGCIAWVVSLIFAGHFLQIWIRKQFGFELRDHLEIIILVIVAVTTTPVLVKILSNKNKPGNSTPN